MVPETPCCDYVWTGTGINTAQPRLSSLADAMDQNDCFCFRPREMRHVLRDKRVVADVQLTYGVRIEYFARSEIPLPLNLGSVNATSCVYCAGTARTGIWILIGPFLSSATL